MPTRSDPTRWYAALASLVVAVLLAWLLGAVLTLTPGERTAVQVAFVTLGLVAAVAIVWYLRPTEAPPPDAADTMRDDALVAIAAARARLPRGALHASPVVLMLGAEGSDTTGVATRSGLDPELLAGDADGSATANANVWKVGGAVLVEAGAPLLGDTDRWKRFVRALRAPRVAAAVGHGEAAPRAVVACVSCGLFYAGGGAQLDALAQLLRQRLSEVANDWGLSLPVYVVFTQADLVPHFEAWAAPLTRDEARAPLGAALPFDAGAGAAGSYAERVAPRLDAAFRQLAESLAGWRLTLLGRESVAERRFAAYEFAREIGKLAPGATRFLAELCRPTQLGTSPMLRGFYFVGIRPVVVGDVAAPTPLAAATAPAAVRVSDATGVFAHAPFTSAPAPASMGYAAPTARRVPQWTFLDRLFPEVVLADTGALAAARGGTRVSGLRRALLGAGIAAALVAIVGVATSWVNNRALARRVETAARGVAALPPAAAGALASVESLARLDTLRTLLDTVRAYDAEDPPFRFRWGLWRDGALFAEGRRVWLAAYGPQLHERAWTTLADSLRALPATPRATDDYARVYEELRAYLVTTDVWARATPLMVAPVLARSWQRGEPVSVEAAALAERQFAFYASLLPAGNPFPRAADHGIVDGARRLLAGFGGSARIYQAKVDAANRRYPAASLASLAPQAPEVLRVPADVPGAFTATSWRYMDSTFRDTSVVVQGDGWVVGELPAAQMPDRALMLAELQASYRREYVQRWRAFVRDARVTPMTDPRDAVSKLRVLRDARSPLFATFALAARNTAVDSSIGAAFQPVHLVSPAQETDRLFTEASQAYVGALDGLLAAVEQVANLSTLDDSTSVTMRSQGASQVLTGQLAAAKTAARTLARDFAADTAAMGVRDAASTLLLAPMEEVERVLSVLVRERPRAAPIAGGGEPPEQIARRVTALARGLCADLKPLLDKFPFAPRAREHASYDEVKAIFAPATGKLWLMYADGLDGLVVKQGTSWAADAAAPVKLSATFVNFFDRAARASDGLFSTGGPELQVDVSARGLPSGNVKSVELTSGGQRATLARDASPAQVSWAPTSRSASLKATFERNMLRDQNRPIADGRNEWALFRLAAMAQWSGTGSRQTATWRSSGDAVSVEFTFPKAAPVLVPGWLGAMGCTAEVVR